MSGYPEVGENALQVVRDTDDDTKQAAAAYVQRRATAGNWPAADVSTVLEHLGLRTPVKPTGGKTTPIGGNVTPAVQQARRERNKANKRAARAEAKRKETS